MALPLDEGMFPETLVEAFVDAPQVAELADEVMAGHDEFAEIAAAVRDDVISIAYVFETKPFDQEKEEFKPHTIAKVTKASPLWRSLTERDLVIQFRRTFWDMFTDTQRRAALHHELMHIVVDEGKVSLAPHQVEDFALTVRRFGPILPGRARFAKALLDWQHEQDRPEPTPLRRVEDLAGAVVARMVDDVEAGAESARGLRDLAEATGTDITITAAGRSATIKGKRP